MKRSVEHSRAHTLGAMNLLGVLGVILIVIGVLGMLAILHIGLVPSIITAMVGLLLVVYAGRGSLRL